MPPRAKRSKKAPSVSPTIVTKSRIPTQVEPHDVFVFDGFGVDPEWINVEDEQVVVAVTTTGRSPRRRGGKSRATAPAPDPEPVSPELLQQENELWLEIIHNSIRNLQNLSQSSLPYNIRVGFQYDQLFTQEYSRIVVKGKQKEYFEIFPWFLFHHGNKPHRFRESLKPGLVELIIYAMNYFWTARFTRLDHEIIRNFALRNFSPQAMRDSARLTENRSSTYSTVASGRCLSSILFLKYEIEKNRANLGLYRQIKTVVSEQERRLAHLECLILNHSDAPVMKKLRRPVEIGLEACFVNHEDRLKMLETMVPPILPTVFLDGGLPLHDFDNRMMIGYDDDPLPLLSDEVISFPTTAYGTDRAPRISRDHLFDNIISTYQATLITLQDMKARELKDPHRCGDDHGLDNTELKMIQNHAEYLLSLIPHRHYC
jgi:hypothetical protein